MIPRLALCRCVLATLSGFLVACTDLSTAPTMRAPGEGAASRARSTSTRIVRTSNTVKYSDAGAQPTSITVNGITLSSRAYALADGRTLVDVVTGRFDAPVTTTRIYGMAFDVYDPTGHRIKPRALASMIQDAKFDWKNGMPSIRFTVRGLARSSRLEFTLIAGGTGKRATRNTLRMVTPVKWAPDLEVSRIDVPSSVHATEVVNVIATVQERRGDYGARADCVLRADGVEVDRAVGIWVDAGGTVSCAFATRFASLGTKQLRVSLESVTPAEYDPADNANATSVAVVPLPVAMTYHVEALQHTGHVTEEYTSVYDNVVDDYHSTYTLDRVWDDQNQSAWVLASAPVPVTFPLDKLSLSMKADGKLVDTRSYANVPGGTPFGTAAEGGTCGQNGDSGFGFIVCTYWSAGAAWSTVYYNQDYSGTVTYESRELTVVTTPAGTVPGTPGYVRNDDAWGKFNAWDRSLGFSISLTDGLYELVASPVLTLFDNQYGNANKPCSVTAVEFGTVTECRDIHEQYFDKGAVAAQE